MPDIRAMIDDVLRREGGFVDHPHDRGGPTKYGITMRTLSRHLGRDISKDDVASLSEETARAIYTQAYYTAPKIDQLPASIQPFVFDCAVNHGPRRAIQFVQTVCNLAGYTPALSADGIMGPNTRKAADWAAQEWDGDLLQALVEERREFYLGLVASDPSQQVFLTGWLNRLKEFAVTDA